MGIRGFTSYLRNEGYLKKRFPKGDFSWLELISNRTLYVDGSAFHNYIQATLAYNTVFYRYAAFRETVEEFNKATEYLNIQVVIVHDGVHRYDLNTWKQRRAKDASVLRKAFDTGNGHNLHMIGAGGLMETLLRGTHIKSELDADSELNALIAQDDNIGGVISSDSDFSLLKKKGAYWFCTNNRDGSTCAVPLPLKMPPEVYGLLAAFGGHELFDTETIAVVQQTFKSFQDIVEKGVEETYKELRQLTNHQLESNQKQKFGLCLSKKLLKRVVDRQWPARVITITSDFQDYADNVYSVADSQWTINVCSRFYGLFVEKPVTYHTYIITIDEYLSRIIQPLSCENVDIFNVHTSDVTVRGKILGYLLGTKVPCDLFVALWKTFVMKVGKDTVRDGNLLLTGLICYFGLPWKARPKRDDPSADTGKAFSTVYRWMKHVTFVMMLDKFTGVWSPDIKRVDRFFDGDVYRSIFQKLKEGIENPGYYLCKHKEALKLYKALHTV